MLLKKSTSNLYKRTKGFTRFGIGHSVREVEHYRIIGVVGATKGL